MTLAREPGRHGPSRRWACLVAAQILLCIGVGLASIVFPEESNPPPGYYDGDGDDAVTTPERIFSNVVLPDQPTQLPILTHVLLGLAVAPVSQSSSSRSQPPLSRSPPA
jgi:hypothetical protein